jgi:hypothetical protein
MVLFLDFDGVLYPTGATDTHFIRLPLLESFLRERAMANLRIVISSSWRQAFTLDMLRQMFAQDIGARVAGVTPSLCEYRTVHQRGEEIEAWLVKHPAQGWVALDDDLDAFEPHLRHRVVLCDGSLGVTDRDLLKLKRAVCPSIVGHQISIV